MLVLTPSLSLQDVDGEFARRAAQRAQGGGPPGGIGMGVGGMGMGPGAPPMVNIPPSLLNNPNIPNEIIHGLQAGKIGSTVFVANVRRRRRVSLVPRARSLGGC